MSGALLSFLSVVIAGSCYSLTLALSRIAEHLHAIRNELRAMRAERKGIKSEVES